MKYSEAKKAIEALSSKYSVDFYAHNYAHKFNVYYKNELTAGVKKDFIYSFISRENIFNKLPFSNKLYVIMSELAITPLDERVEEKKYQVKAFGEYLNLNVITSDTFLSDKNDTEDFKTKFTIKEIDNFKQRNDIPLDWNKVTLEEAE